VKAGGGIAIGLLLAFVAHYVAFALGGAGHGWTAPFFASVMLWIFLPLTFATVSPLGPYRQGGGPYRLILISIALIADASLLFATFREGTEYFWKIMDLAGGFVILWLSIWTSWQLIALISLSNGEERPDSWS